MATAKFRWGDALDEEDMLPPSTVRGPDENGFKTLVEYYKNDKGEAIKKITKMKVVKVDKKVYKVSEERRNWKRFGAASRDSESENVTMRGQEDIPFERIRQTKATSKEKQAQDLQTIMATQDKAAISGSLKDILYKKRMERELLRAKGLLKAAEKPPDEDGKPSSPSSSTPSAPKPGSYVPPSLRGKMGGPATMDGDSMKQRRDENSLRVSNLSEDVTEQDLQELFKPFGPVGRVFLSKDRTTGENRGYAFVNYVTKEGADRALRSLNGYGYDNLILRVEWAERREK